ncbi:MAG TPA: thiamine pyrophosphate-dependent enzyme, partial [Chloroflexota bacterium]
VHHHIPVLLFVLNNGGYIGEGGHMAYTAEQRDRTAQGICIDFKNPEVDYSSIARGCGAYTEGPIEDPAALGPAIARAVKVVKEQSTIAVIDVKVG